MANISKETPNEGLEKTVEIIAKHYPDETPAELLARMQHLLEFMGSLPEKLLSYHPTPQRHSPLSVSQTGILHQFNHNKSSAKPEQANLKQDKLRAALLAQIEQIQAIRHLEPAQKISAKLKPR